MIQCNVQIGSLVRSLQPKAQYFVDAMSSFGAVPLNLEHVDWVVSSANKCLQVEPCCPNLTVGDLHWGYMCCLHGQLSFNEIPSVCFSTLEIDDLSKGVPGFSYAICRSSVLSSCKGNARSLSLDLEDQVFAWVGSSEDCMVVPCRTLT